MADPVAVATGLGRTYRTTVRRPGLRGAVADLVAPRRDTLTALTDVDLEVFPGEVVGLLGANGAGKSTFVKCLVGLLQPTTGTVAVGGRDPWAERRTVLHDVGVVFGQRSQLWWDLAVRESFDLLGEVFGVPHDVRAARLATLSDVLDLEPLLGRTVRELSLGQRMRCDLAASQLHEPSLLVLDEPTVGLDVGVKRRVRAFVRQRAAAGAAVLLTTHDLGDVAALCDRVVLLETGRVRFEGTLDAFRRRLGGARRLVVRPMGPVTDATIADLATRLGADVNLTVDGDLEVVLHAADRTVDAVQTVLAAVPALDVAVREPSLEDVVADLYDRGDG